ncbi:MAG: hypothetical protein JST44_12935 [Cyanobacteria bacterium SZAS LIN-5]|nr:hypothetical protein [Cyanobacteria bacterium SZAS LIN-5]
MQQLRKLLAAFLMAASLAGCAEVRDPIQSKLCPKPIAPSSHTNSSTDTKANESWSYTPLVYPLDNRRTLQIWDYKPARYVFLQDGKPIHAEQAKTGAVSLISPETFEYQSSPAFHLTGTNALFVVIQEEESNGQFLDKVFKVANGMPKVTEFHAHGSMSVFKEDGVYKFKGRDDLPGFGAKRPDLTIVFKLQHGKLKFDKKSLKRMLPSDAELRNASHSIRQKIKEQNDAPIELFDNVIALCYCGETQKAKQFFNEAYPRNVRGKSFWWKFIQEQIKLSPYHKQIKG